MCAAGCFDCTWRRGGCSAGNRGGREAWWGKWRRRLRLPHRHSCRCLGSARPGTERDVWWRGPPGTAASTSRVDVSVGVPTRQLWGPAPHRPCAVSRAFGSSHKLAARALVAPPGHPSPTISPSTRFSSQIFKNFIPCPFYHLALSSSQVTPTLLLRCNRRIETARSGPRESQIVPPTSF